jgi:hypothetical protein
MSRHLSVRIGEDVFRQLEAQSRTSGQSRSAVAKQLLAEGLRMEQHPRIIFRSGPGGRRPGLIGGPDVWEVVGALREGKIGDGDGLAGSGERTGLTTDQIGAALRYYAEYTDEVGAWIRRVEDEAERAEAQWRREQELLAR